MAHMGVYVGLGERTRLERGGGVTAHALRASVQVGLKVTRGTRMFASRLISWLAIALSFVFSLAFFGSFHK